MPQHESLLLDATISGPRNARKLGCTFENAQLLMITSLLREIIANADGVRAVRINKEWKQFDPHVWDMDMGVKIKVGLGTGTRERDMRALQAIFLLQKEIFAALGPDNPLVKPNQFYNTLEKIVEASGLPNAEPYFTKSDPAELNRRLAESKNRPNPEMIKVQGQIELEKAKIAGSREKEKALMEADLVTKRAYRDANVAIEQIKRQSEDRIATLNAQIEREKIASNEAIEQRKLDQQAMLDAERVAVKRAGANSHDSPSV